MKVYMNQPGHQASININAFKKVFDYGKWDI